MYACTFYQWREGNEDPAYAVMHLGQSRPNYIVSRLNPVCAFSHVRLGVKAKTNEGDNMVMHQDINTAKNIDYIASGLRILPSSCSGSKYSVHVLL